MIKFNSLRFTALAAGVLLVLGSCQKMERPTLGDYLKDANPPGGPLKFYAAFDGTSSNVLMNAVDSIRANFASTNPLATVDGISGKAIKGADGKSLTYANANDFKSATSLSIAFWMKNTDAGRTEFVFSLVDDKYGWHHSAIFLLLEHGSPTATTLKLGLMDQWLEFPDANKFQKPLLDGNWHHIAFVYDQATSKMKYYFDGAEVSGVPASASDVKSGGNPRGPLDLKTSHKLILGGWNKHGSAEGPGDDWIKSYTGSLDQFRLYSKALTAAEVAELYSGKK